MVRRGGTVPEKNVGVADDGVDKIVDAMRQRGLPAEKWYDNTTTRKVELSRFVVFVGFIVLRWFDEKCPIVDYLFLCDETRFLDP